MKERGRYQIQCMKSRSSTGVGQKIDLEYNIDTMRISDPGEEAMGSAGSSDDKVSAILNKAKPQVSVAVNQSTGEIMSNPVGKLPNAEVNSTKLKGMLSSMKAPK
jgi:hypothetical protein